MDSSNVRTIPIGDISESPLNPRKTFDAGELADLTISIREHGVWQDIVVRPTPLDPDQYEVVMGARRLRAARNAGLTELQCKVTTLDDRSARAAAVVENEQRVGVPILEKVDGYQAMLDDGATLVDVARISGKSVGTVRALLKLRQVGDEVKTALTAGRISESMATLIAAQPTVGLRLKVVGYAMPLMDRAGNSLGDADWPSVRRVKEWIVANLRVELKQAPFNTADKGLLVDVGSCKACPKRAGNAKEEYGDLRADTCLDPDCYRMKVDAWERREEAGMERREEAILMPTHSKALGGGSAPKPSPADVRRQKEEEKAEQQRNNLVSDALARLGEPVTTVKLQAGAAQALRIVVLDWLEFMAAQELEVLCRRHAIACGDDGDERPILIAHLDQLDVAGLVEFMAETAAIIWAWSFKEQDHAELKTWFKPPAKRKPGRQKKGAKS